MIYVFELPHLPESLYEAGIPVVVSKIRRNHPRAIDPAIKSGNFLNNILAYKDAKDAGAHEAIFCNSEGYLAEGTTSNVFLVKGGMAWTPHPVGILDGITRGVVFEEGRAAGISIGETNIRRRPSSTPMRPSSPARSRRSWPSPASTGGWWGTGSPAPSPTGSSICTSPGWSGSAASGKARASGRR